MPDIKSAMQAALLRAPAHAVVQKTINEWDDEGEQHFPINISSVTPVQTKPVQDTMPTTPEKIDGRTKNHMQRETFYCIKNNPGNTAKHIGTLMAQRGYNHSSVTATCSHMIQAGMVRRDDNRLLYTVANEYNTLPAPPARKINRMKKQIEALKEIANIPPTKKYMKRKTVGKGIKALPVQQAAHPANTGIASLSTPVPAPAPAPLPMPTPAPVVNEFDPKTILDPLTVYQARALYNELEAMFGGGYGRSA